MPSTQPVRVRVGVFELDLSAGELRAMDGAEATGRIVLAQQPLRVLSMLLERPGLLVTREEIQKKLWPNDTVVEFEHSINAAIAKLRKAFGDSANEPRYIETIARRGYRLIAATEWLTDRGESPSITSGGNGAAARMQLEPAVLTGRVVSHYRVLDIVGGGGMGVVYRAEDLKLGRQVALKFLPEEVGDDAAALERFEREARAASALDHPNICSIYEFGEHEGQPFIVMQLLEGETLRERLATAALQPPSREDGGGAAFPLEELLDIASQIADGLQAAHERGIIHRDIKPANIFITRRGLVKILDFGVAKLMESAEAADLALSNGEAPTGPVEEGFRLSKEQGLVSGHDFSRAAAAPYSDSSGLQPATPADTRLTRTGLAMGTVGYMSPEQVRGDKVDARTDIFSFGVVLYEMATGQRAFSGETAAATHNAILNQTPASAHDRNTAIPPKLEQIIGRAIEKERERRYQSVKEMCAELKMVDPHATEFSSRGPISRRWKWPAAAALIMSILIAGAFSWWQHRKAITLRKNATLVLASFTNSTGNPVFDGALQAALYNNLEQSPYFNELNTSKINNILQSMEHTTNVRLTPEVARQVCLRSNSAAVIAGSIADAGNRYRIELEALRCESGATMAKIEAAAEDQNTVVRTLGLVGTALRLKLGEPQASVQKFNRPLDQALTSSVEALQAFYEGYFTAPGDSQVASHYRRAIELDPNFAMAHWFLAEALRDLNEVTLSDKSYAQAYQLRSRMNERDKLSLEARYYTEVTGEFEKAIQALEETTRTYPEHYYDHNGLGTLYQELGQSREAAAQLRIGMQIDPESAAASLMDAYISLDQLEQAQSVFQEARARGEDDPLLHFSRYSLAFMQNDNRGMAEQLAWATGKAKVEDVLFSKQADTEAFHGRFNVARGLAHRAVSSAQQADAKETSAGWLVEQALREAEVGNVSQAKQLSLEALSLSHDRKVRVGAALALARAGDVANASKLADQIDQEFPSNTLFQGYSLPTIRAAVALQANDPERAIAVLNKTERYELAQYGLAGLYPVYLRGQAYLKLGKGQQAAAELQKMIDHPGIVLNFVTGALAHLQLGRARAMMGDKTAARKSYQDFLTLWKDADPDIPICRQAKAEYARLQ